jgi:hypothetical protein
VDQLALPFTPAGIGHNQPPETIDPTEVLNARLTNIHTHLLARFRELERACGHIPDPIPTEEDAAAATDFIAQWQQRLKQAKTAHKQEKAPFLRGERAVSLFNERSECLAAALVATAARLKAYRMAAEDWQHHGEARGRAARQYRRALTEAEAHHRARRERLARAAQSFEKRREAAGALRLADEESARAKMQIASAPIEPTRIRGNDGATAFVRHSWSFEIVDLDRVPREYMSLDVRVVREAITQGGIRYIPGLLIFQTEELRARATPSPSSDKSLQRGQAVEKSSADAAKQQSSDKRPPGPRTPKRRGRVSGGSDHQLVVPIKPIWGDQKVLWYYRQVRASLKPNDADQIAKFHAANAAIEARLWRKLPQRMEEIEFLYSGSRVSPEAGEGAPK